jgi:Putative addiction module component
MPRPIETLAEEVLQLPTEARSKLLDRVVASLDVDHKRDEAWDAIAARRDAEIDSGQSVPVPGPQVIAHLRSQLK